MSSVPSAGVLVVFASMFGLPGPRTRAGSAPRAIRRRMRRRGFRVDPPARFTVTGGPLAESELDRARRWGAELAAGSTAVARSGT